MTLKYKCKDQDLAPAPDHLYGGHHHERQEHRFDQVALRQILHEWRGHEEKSQRQQELDGGIASGAERKGGLAPGREGWFGRLGCGVHWPYFANWFKALSIGSLESRIMPPSGWSSSTTRKTATATDRAAETRDG
jgi:hypothetical protein